MAATTQTWDVAVVGGGLAGLAAATTAARDGRRVVLLDAGALGGRARSTDRDGFTFNMGPHALYRGGPAERVLGDLGVAPTGGPPATSAWGVRAGELVPLASTPLSLLASRALTWREKIAVARFFVAVRRTDPAAVRGRTVTEWLAGLRLDGMAADVARSAIRVGTYTDAPDLLGADVAVTQLRTALGPGVRYLDGGWGGMVAALAERARAAGVELRSGARVTAVDDGPQGPVVATADAALHCGAVVVASGTPDAAGGLLGGRPAAWSALGPPVTASCLDLGVRGVPTHRAVIGLDEPTYCSVHSPPADLAPEGCAVVAVAEYHRPGADRSDPTEQRRRLEAVARRAGIDDDDVVTARFLHAMVVAGAVPTAEGGGLGGRPEVAVPGRPGVFVAGDWVGADGFLADAALASGADAGRRAAAVAARARVGTEVPTVPVP
jgi:phytoene dehydrogenase-like protein